MLRSIPSGVLGVFGSLALLDAISRSAVMGAGLGKHVALMTDGRFSGGSHGFIIGHVSPEAAHSVTRVCDPA